MRIKKETIKNPWVIFCVSVLVFNIILFVTNLTGYFSITTTYSDKVIATVTNVEAHSEPKIGLFDTVHTVTEYTYTYSYQYNGEEREWKTDKGDFLAKNERDMRIIYINPNNPEERTITLTVFCCVLNSVCIVISAISTAIIVTSVNKDTKG